MPSAIAAVIAGRPSRVAGILISALGRSTADHRARAEAMVPVGVVGQVGLDLDRDPAVGRRAVGDGREDVAGVADVLGGELEDHLGDVGAVGDQLAHLLVVALAVGDGAGEDRRVRGHADDVLVLDEVGEVAGLDALAGEVVEPDGHPGVGQGLQTVTHALLPSRMLSRARVGHGRRR